MILGVFIGLAVSWSIVVINATVAWPPYQAWSLALGGGFTIGIVGMRIAYKVEQKILARELAPIRVVEPVTLRIHQPYRDYRDVPAVRPIAPGQELVFELSDGSFRKGR